MPNAAAALFGCAAGLAEMLLNVRLFRGMFRQEWKIPLLCLGIKLALYAALLYALVKPLRAGIVFGCAGYALGFAVGFGAFAARALRRDKEE